MTRRKIERMAKDVVRAGWDQIKAAEAFDDMEGNKVQSVFLGIKRNIMPHILFDGFVDDEFSGVPPVIVVVDLGHLEFLKKKIPLVHALREADEDLAGVSFWDYSPQWYKFNIYDSDYEFFENLDGSVIILDELPEKLKRLESQYDPDVPNHRISVELPEVSFRGRAPHEISFKCYLKNTQIQIYTGTLDLNELDKIPRFKGTERVEE